MKTIRELQDSDMMPNAYYIRGYEDAIEGILKDIKESGSISVQSIEKYLEDLLK